MSTTDSSRTSSASSQTPGWFAKNRIWFFLVVLFAISNSGIYFYQRYQRTKQKEEFAELLDKKGKLGEDLLALKNAEGVQMLSKTLVWGVRAEMMRGNKELIDQFLIEVVQETEADLVIVADTNNVIYLSTDKKYENQSVNDILPSVPVDIRSPKVLKSELNEMTVAAPIMGDERKIGALFLTYKPSKAAQMLLDDIKTNPMAEKVAAQE